MSRQKALTVLVTGGSGGIGTAVCKNLADRGHKPVVLDKSPPSDGYCYVEVDLGVSGRAAESVRRATDGFGQLDAVVNCVGYYGCLALESFTWEDFEQSLQINLRAPIEIILAWLTHRVSQGRGTVVNIGSAGATLGSRDLAYAATKGALESATKSLARSLCKRNIFVYGIAPGIVDTEMSRRMPSERRQQHIQSTLLGRAGRPSEIADLVLFLLCCESDYLVGSVLNASCGLVW